MKNYLRRMDKPLVIICAFLFVFGLIMILSASNMEAIVRYGYSPYYYFVRQLAFLISGTLIAIVISNINTAYYKKFAYILLLGGIALLVILYAKGVVSHSSKSWFPIFGSKIQPSEFLKPIFIVFLAVYYENIMDKFNDFKHVFLRPLLITGVIFLLIFFQPDLGTASIFVFLFLLVFTTISSSKEIKKKVGMLIGGGFVLLLLLLVTVGDKIVSPEQMERLDFTNPCARYQDSGYQVCNGFIAINNGGLLGAGLGQSTQKYLYLPDAHNDFIFAIVMEEMGLLFSIFIIGLYLVLLRRIIKIGNNALTIRGKVICYGSAFLMLVHILINLLGLFALIPYTGVPLPFLSYGGSFTWSLFVVLGLVSAVNNETIVNSKKEIKV